MYKIGEKVYLDHDRDFIGYIIGIEIVGGEDLYELRRYVENRNIIYTVRCFAPHYSGGYYDFTRMESEIKYAD